MLLSLQFQAKQVAEALAQALEAKAQREKEALLRAEERRQAAESQRADFCSIPGPFDDSHFEEGAYIAAAATEIGASFGHTLRKYVPAQQ